LIFAGIGAQHTSSGRAEVAQHEKSAAPAQRMPGSSPAMLHPFIERKRHATP
jgi:hypothetical protein